MQGKNHFVCERMPKSWIIDWGVEVNEWFKINDSPIFTNLQSKLKDNPSYPKSRDMSDMCFK